MSLELLSKLHFDQSINRTFSSLSGSWKRFCFSTNMDEYSELAEKAFNGDFPELPKCCLWSLKHSLKSLLKAQNQQKAKDLFCKINLNISISKSTFYPSSNIKILAKTITDYLLMNNFVFRNTIYKITKNHGTI